ALEVLRGLQPHAVQGLDTKQTVVRIIESLDRRLGLTEEGTLPTILCINASGHFVRCEAPAHEEELEAIQEEERQGALDLVWRRLQRSVPPARRADELIQIRPRCSIGGFPEVQEHPDDALRRAPQAVGIAASAGIQTETEIARERIELVCHRY